jgi:hypothetical protein
VILLQSTNAQAKHGTVKPAEEKRIASKSQKSARPGGPDNVCSDDGKYVENIFFTYMIFLNINIM